MLLYLLMAGVALGLKDSPVRRPVSPGRNLLADHDHDSNSVRCDAVADASLPNVAFGVGNLSSGIYYDDNMNCTWLIPQGNKAITIVFSMFHIEKNYDRVDIFNNGVQIGSSLSGELVVPFAIRIPNAGLVEVHFTSDDTFHLATSENTQALQIGFQATFILSDAGQCPGNCGDPLFGTCVAGVCNCSASRLGADCSIPVPLLQPGDVQNITNLRVGRWAYFRVESPSQTLLIETTDFGAAASDVFLAASPISPPTFSTNPQYMDWFNWYYDASDLHLVRILNAGPRYYVGVTNHILRSQALVNANITLRATVAGKVPCIANCSGHGVCRDNGSCECDPGYTGDHMGSRVCNFRIKTVMPSEFPFQSAVNVRVGDWIFYKFTLTAADVRAGSSMLVSLWSSNPRARPILLVAQGYEPDLAWGYLPTFDAFDADFGDEPGFDMLSGMQQNILVKGAPLRPGEWYVAVFNIWGFTGIDIESHDSASVELYVNLFEAGIPCPRAHNDFCSGEACDFNTGLCKCPVTRLGSACGFQATEILHSLPAAFNVELDIGHTHYFVLNVSSQTRAIGRNFQLRMTRGPDETKATVFLLARKGDIPFSENYTEWDDHAFADSYYHEETLTLVLDREELTLGLWYFAVINTQQSVQAIRYTLLGEFKDVLPCPSSETKPPVACYGRGSCNSDLGRCICAPGATSDDCSADGVFLLRNGQPAANTPSIPKDSWAYWGFAVGCENLTLEVRFNEAIAAGGVQNSAPMLTMRQGRLPLMIEGTFDYTDFYRGLERHLPNQGISVTTCNDFQGMTSCVVSPYPYGTKWATGYIKPGIWFIGVYNDWLEADGPILTYSLSAMTIGSCPKCAEGFLGPTCDILCPGMWPEQAYANSPFRTGQSCSGHGVCSLNGQTGTCKCAEFYHGPACETSCPGMRTNANNTLAPCSRHGKCVFPKCICDEGYNGDDCSIHCPGVNTTGKECSGLGECLINGDGDSVCKCNPGYAGEDCANMCPNKCNARGDCLMVLDNHHTGSKDYEAECSCQEGYFGESCEQVCPGMAAGHPCNGQGFCSPALVGSGLWCFCFEGFGGPTCAEVRTPAPQPEGTSSGGSYSAMIAVLCIVAVVSVIGMVYFGYVVKKQRAALRRYESPMLDEEPTKDDDGQPAHTTKSARTDRGQEMQTLNRAPDSESLQDVPLENEKVEYL